MACLLRTFLEMSTNSKYIHSLYLSTLFHVHVLKEDLPCPPLPPYYSRQFFETIISAIQEGQNIENMTIKQWYNYLLLQDYSTKDPNQQRILLPCKAELASPVTKWDIVWNQVRLPCLGSENSSFIWRLLHRLLPTEARLAEIQPQKVPTCRQNCPRDQSADLIHVFFKCKLSENVGNWLTKIVEQTIPLSSPALVLKLDMDGNEALIWIVVRTLLFIWKLRQRNKTASLVDCLATLTSEVKILASTRHSITVAIIKNYISI